MPKLLLILLLTPLLSMCQPLSLTGTVLNEEGAPIEGATITIKRAANIKPQTSNIEHQTSNIEPQTSNIEPPTTQTDEKGGFTIFNLRLNDTLLITAVGYEETRQVFDYPLVQHAVLTVRLRRRVGLLDETVIIAYGTTTRRLATGSISKMPATDIARQPVSNPLQALDGRIPGLTAVQGTGLPGAMVKVQVRGQSSLVQGSEPLYIIDGVPFATGNNNINRLTSALNTVGNAGLSPFNTLSAEDIESIEVLKDADATAIYGSRGAAGVILISTKKGRAGKTAFSATFSTGISKASRLAPMLSGPQYLQMRREAFAADGLTPTAAIAPDLLVWDTTRYTDFNRLLLGGTAHHYRASASVAGGNAQTTFLLSATGQRESTIVPGSQSDGKANLNLNLSHRTAGNRFRMAFSALYGVNDNRLTATNLAAFINLPPNAPELYTPDGQLNWEEGGAAFQNPFAYAHRTYQAQTANLVSNLQLSLQLLRGLEFRTALGHNRVVVDEKVPTPIAAQNPAAAPRGTAQFAHSTINSWIAEPQLHYEGALLGGRLTVVTGATWQKNNAEGLSIVAGEFTNDALLQSLAAAPAISSRSNSFSQYRYAAAFGRINYNWQSKYLLNLSGRRDGSSRFGPGRQWANFAAIGAGWIFSAEPGIKKSLPFLGFGKLRGSYGTTGNDQIGDYRYLDAWRAARPYQNATALFPSALFNPQYSWELTKKTELALELGLLSNRLNLTVSWYSHRSSNQLLNYVLPAQTGFTGILSNFPATVQNRGWEFDLRTTNLTGQNFSWNTSFNISIPRNRLVAFPGIEASSYASTYMVGKPLNLVYRYQSDGVDPATGVFSFTDVNKDGFISAPADLLYGGDLSPRFFGGFGNDFTFKQLSLNFFLVFKKQWGTNYLGALYAGSFVPGLMYNQPTYVLDRWQAPGDITEVQKFTASTSSAAYAARNRFSNSGGIYSDASFLRLKTVELAFQLPAGWINKKGLGQGRLFLQGQNLLTLTTYKGSDPETQNLYAMPPLKTVVAGIQITF